MFGKFVPVCISLDNDSKKKQGLAHTKPLLLITVVLLQAPFMTQVYIRQSEEQKKYEQ